MLKKKITEMNVQEIYRKFYPYFLHLGTYFQIITQFYFLNITLRPKPFQEPLSNFIVVCIVVP